MPTRGQDGNKLHIVGGEVRKQLRRQNLTKHSPCKHDTSIREIQLALTLIIGAYDEARIHNSQVFESGILGHDGPYDGKIDIRSS